MKRRFFLSVLALFCSVLSGCDFFVTENSDPDTADEVAAMVNGKFHTYGAQDNVLLFAGGNGGAGARGADHDVLSAGGRGLDTDALRESGALVGGEGCRASRGAAGRVF